MEIKIYNLSDELVENINILSKKQKVSRNEFLKRILENEISLYTNSFLLDDHSSIRKQLSNQLERNNYLFEIIIEELGEIKNG